MLRCGAGRRLLLRALRIREHGGVDRLLFEDVPEPVPGPGEARVRVRAAGVNHLDLWVRRGVPGHRFPLPITPGCDAAGEIDRLGPGVTGWKEGDAVVLAPGLSCGVCPACLSGEDHLCPEYGILGESRDGTDAPYVVVPARNLMTKPENLGFEDAASFALTLLTAWHMLVARAALRPGETVLIHAAGSGVSSAAIQIASLFGARIIATARSEEKRTRALALGAHHAIDSQAADLAAAVRAITGRRGVDVVLDHVGTPTFGPSLRTLGRGGRYVFCGSTAGFEMSGDFRLLFFRNLSILGSTMGSLGELRRIRDLVEAGRLRPVVARVLPLEQVAEAHRLLEERRIFGKIVLTMAPPESAASRAA